MIAETQTLSLEAKRRGLTASCSMSPVSPGLASADAADLM